MYHDDQLQVIRNIGSGHDQTNGDERKNKKKKNHRRTRKLYETKLCGINLIKDIKICPPYLQDSRDHSKLGKSPMNGKSAKKLAKKVKLREKNRISFNSNTKYRHKDQ